MMALPPKYKAVPIPAAINPGTIKGPANIAARNATPPIPPDNLHALAAVLAAVVNTLGATLAPTLPTALVVPQAPLANFLPPQPRAVPPHSQAFLPTANAPLPIPLAAPGIIIAPIANAEASSGFAATVSIKPLLATELWEFELPMFRTLEVVSRLAYCAF